MTIQFGAEGENNLFFQILEVTNCEPTRGNDFKEKKTCYFSFSILCYREKPNIHSLFFTPFLSITYTPSPVWKSNTSLTLFSSSSINKAITSSSHSKTNSFKNKIHHMENNMHTLFIFIWKTQQEQNHEKSIF